MATETLSLEQILAYVEITGLMYEVTTGLPDPLPAAFKTNKKEVVGDEGRIMVRRGQRQTARRVEYGGKARNRGLISIGYKDAKLVHFSEEMQVNPNLLLKLRDTLSYTNQQQGRDELKEQAKQFAELFTNTEITMRQMALSTGHIYFDAEGNLLPTSSGAVLDVDYGMSANHQNQLNGIIAQSWDNSSTDIPQHVINLKKQQRRESGLPLKYALYTETIPSMLFKNDFMQNYLARNEPQRSQWLATGEIPDGVLGLTWVPVWEGFFEDQNSTNQNLWSTDKVVFTPDPALGDWWRQLFGSIMVPTSLNVAGEGAAALDNCKVAYGLGGYGFVERSPVKVVMNYFHTLLPALQNPDAIWQADVTP